MAAIVLRRLAAAALLLLVTSFVVFAFVHLAPGSPETVLLGGRRVSAEQLAALRERYHLDQPLLVQYGYWLGNILVGDLGQSIASQTPVSTLIAGKVLPTLELAAYAGLLVLVLGVALGVVAAVRHGRPVDHLISILAVLGASLATYVSAILLIVLFAQRLGWFPVFGLGDGGPLDRLYHLTLPAIALAVFLTALVTRVTRAAMIGVLRQEHVETARSRGLGEARIVLTHGLRGALVPVLTISGLVVGYLITGSVLVEFTFGLNGLGAQLVTSIQARDFAVVQAVALLFTAAFIVVNLVVDVLYALVDPRVRERARRA